MASIEFAYLDGPPATLKYLLSARRKVFLRRKFVPQSATFKTDSKLISISCKCFRFVRRARRSQIAAMKNERLANHRITQQTMAGFGSKQNSPSGQFRFSVCPAGDRIEQFFEFRKSQQREATWTFKSFDCSGKFLIETVLRVPATQEQLKSDLETFFQLKSSKMF